jgi:hypothetical protein
MTFQITYADPSARGCKLVVTHKPPQFAGKIVPMHGDLFHTVHWLRQSPRPVQFLRTAMRQSR